MRVVCSSSRSAARICASIDGVDRRRRVVEDQHPRLAHERARQRDALALARPKACSRARPRPCRSRAGRRPTNGRPPRSRAARSTASSFAPESSAMFSRIVVANRKLSWNTIETARRSACGSTCRRSTPPIRTVPSSGSASRTSSCARVLLPPPGRAHDRDGFLGRDLAGTRRSAPRRRRGGRRRPRTSIPSGPSGSGTRVARRAAR